MYDKNPMKKAIVAMNVGEVISLPLEKRGYIKHLMHRAIVENNRVYTSRQNKEHGQVDIIRLR